MIIGIDASRANTSDRTGTEWYSYHLIQELKQIIPAQHTVRLYSKEVLRSDLLPLPENWETRVLSWPLGRFWTQLRLSIEMLLHPPDVLYVPAHTIPVIAPKKTVTVIHDVGFYESPELYSSSELSYHRWSFQQAIKKAAIIITISDFSLNAIRKIAPQAADRLRRIYNGLHVRTMELDDSVLDTYALRDRPFFLTIGRVEEKKNSYRLVQAFHEMITESIKNNQPTTAVLVFAGGFGFGYEKITAYIKQHGLENRIIFTHYISDEQIVSLLMSARAFVFPSLYEGFGMPVLEAFYYSVPVLCSDIPVLREIAGEAAAFFDPTDTTAIAHAMNNMLTASQPRDEHVVQGQVRANDFSWRKTAEETWAILKKQISV